MVPGFCQDHGRRTGHWRTAGFRATHSLRHPSAPGTLRTHPGLPLQAWPSSPRTLEEARIRCHQEPPSQQGNGPGREGKDVSQVLWLARKDAPPPRLGTKPMASFQGPSGCASWQKQRLFCLFWPFRPPPDMKRGDLSCGPNFFSKTDTDPVR